jgi:hypothetical protein
MLRRLVAASAFAALVLPGTAAAQDLMSICQKAQHPRVGAWSEFKVVGGRNDGGTMRMSVVGTERRGGTEYFWLEFMMRGFFRGRGEEGAGPERMISKMLVPGLGPGMGRPVATVVKVGDSPAMQMPTGRPSPGGQGRTGLENCRDAKVVGWESVTVPAGRFRALHITGASRHADSWVDPDLPFALVKEASSDEGERSQTVLTGHGMGARSQITERPRPFDAQLMMQMLTGGRARRRP